jgi:hydroxypyruvate isomerase
MKLGICLEMIFTDRPFLERIGLAAQSGCRFAEMWFIDGTFNGTDCASDPKDPEAVAGAAREAGITITSTVVGSPDGSLGGGLIARENQPRWRQRAAATIAFNKRAGIGATIVCSGNVIDGMTCGQMISAVTEHLKPTVELAEKEGVTLLLEPLNTRVDHAGYLIDSSDAGAEICRAIGSERLRLLFDCYHMQIMEGDLLSHMKSQMDVIGHFHAAGVPGRHEIYQGEVNYPYVVKQIEAMGYNGVFALEYNPTVDHLESLRRSLTHLSA